MAKQVLSAFNYFGGKAKMAPLICELLDYTHTNIYIEPYGGGARTLLNKPRHSVEIYNDASAGLCAFMRVMSNPKQAEELINRLYDTEYSPEEFYSALLLRNEVEDNFIDELKRQSVLYLNQLIARYGIHYFEDLKAHIKNDRIEDGRKTYQKIIDSGMLRPDEIDVLKGDQDMFEKYIVFIKNAIPYDWRADYRRLFYVNLNEYKNKEIKRLEFKFSQCNDVRQQEKYKKCINAVENISASKLKKPTRQNLRKKTVKDLYYLASTTAVNNHDVVDFDDIELALATYVIYSQSRDGMGTAWSASKYKSTDDYQSKISKLWDVAERLEGIQVRQVGALGFLFDCSYLNDESAQFYLDPSYLDPENESDNLGGTYKFSSDYADHELLLQTICDAKAHILISNYDLPLYNKYLTAEKNWTKMEFATTTSVGGKADNKRIEVLWKNY